MIYTKEQIKVLYKQAEEKGIDADSFYRALYSRGSEIAGIDNNKIKKAVGLIPEQSETQMGRLGETIADIPQDIAKTGRNIKASFQQGMDRVNEAQQKTIEGEQSIASGTFQTIGEGLKTGARIVGDLFLGAASTLTTPEDEQMVQDKLVQGVQSLGASDVGQGISELATKYNAFKQSNPEIAANLEASLGFAEAILEVTGAGAGLKGAKKGLSAVGEGVEDVATQIGKTASDMKLPKMENFSLGKKVDVPENITNKEVFSEAVKRGFEPEQARVFSEIKDIDKPVAKEMFQLAEDISTGKASVGDIRPIDIVGKKLQDDFKEVTNIQKEIGKGVDDVAKTLKGQVIDTTQLTQKVDDTLGEFNIKLTPDESGKTKIDFSESDFALSEQAQKEIAKAVNFISSGKKDAYAVHRIKKTLDTLIQGSKIGEGLQGQAKSLVQKLRRDADDFLDSNFPEYNNVNTEFKDAIGVVENFKNSFKGNTKESFAQALRRVYSNSEKRGELKNAVNDLQKYLVSKGKTERPDVYNLTEIAERIEDVYGTQAITGLKGQAERALRGTKALAEGLRNPINGIGSIAGDVVERVAKQRPEDRLEFIRNVLNTNGSQAKQIENEVLKSVPKKKMTAAQKSGGYIKNPLFKESDDALVKEAKKYKSADEFVKNKISYRGDSKDTVVTSNNIASGQFGKGLYLSPNRSGAEYFSKQKRIYDEFGDYTGMTQADEAGKVTAFDTSNVKLFDVYNKKTKYSGKDEYFDIIDKVRSKSKKSISQADAIRKFEDKIKKDGYDGIVLSDRGEIVIFPESVSKVSIVDEYKHKSQLEEIWKKSNK